MGCFGLDIGDNHEWANAVAVNILMVCRQTFDSTWSVDPRIGNAGETAEGRDVTMMALCTQHYEKGSPWTPVNLSPAVSYYGNEVKLQKLMVLPANATWIKVFFEDKHLGGIPANAPVYNLSNYPMNTIHVLSLTQTESHHDLDPVVLDREFGNGYCPSSDVCDPNQLPAYSKTIWVGDITQDDPNLSDRENIRKRTLYVLNLPGWYSSHGDPNPGYRITSIKVSTPP